MAAKMIDKLEIACVSFCASNTVIMDWIRRKNQGGRFEPGNGCWSGTKEELLMEF